MTEAMQHEEVTENITARYYQQIAAELAIGRAQVAATAQIIAEGGTVTVLAVDRERHRISLSLKKQKGS